MTLEITKDDAAALRVDRDGVRNDYDAQGFTIWVGGLVLHFEDENDVVDLVKQVRLRLGC